MQSYEVISGPLADAAVWRGALIWALALYVPLSAPLSRLEASLETLRLPATPTVAPGDAQEMPV